MEYVNEALDPRNIRRREEIDEPNEVAGCQKFDSSSRVVCDILAFGRDSAPMTIDRRYLLR